MAADQNQALRWTLEYASILAVLRWLLAVIRSMFSRCRRCAIASQPCSITASSQLAPSASQHLSKGNNGTTVMPMKWIEARQGHCSLAKVEAYQVPSLHEAEILA